MQCSSWRTGQLVGTQANSRLARSPEPAGARAERLGEHTVSVEDLDGGAATRIHIIEGLIGRLRRSTDCSCHGLFLLLRKGRLELLVARCRLSGLQCGAR